MTARSTIDRLIVNSPYEEPARHWRHDRKTRRFDLAPGRRPAGYVVASEDSRAFDDPGLFVEIPLVNAIRPRVKAWREAGWPGASAVTRRLLRYWSDPEEFETRRFFFCQIEAVETLIWLAEAPAAERIGVEVPSDGGGFERVCAKMATGAGKTVVMAMVLAWQILNKVARAQDRRFSRNVLVVAPGLTVRSRLAVLEPSHPENYYEAFHVVPSAMLDRLRRGRVIVRNRHALHWEGEEQVARRRSVDKRGARSDEAWVRDVLGDAAKARDLLVINDEAHHAWRVQEQSGAGTAGIDKAAIEEATRWVGGLDRIDRARGILRCYDFSATPFAPSGRKSSEEALFGWIVSDFGLNDAIEAGLVKTPRVVVRDDAMPDAGTWKSRLYHLYNDPTVRDDLNRRAGAEEPLPDLVLNGYYLLGYDWRETARRWADAGFETPPTMITVANRTETAARVKHAFDTGRVRIDELCDPARTLHIDSRVLSEAEAQDAAEPIAAGGDGVGSREESGSGSRGAGWPGSREVLLARIVRLVEQFVRSDRIVIEPRLFAEDDLKRRLMLALNMTRVVQHVWQAIRFENTEQLTLVFDRDHPIRSTGDMATWHTGRPCDRTARSHVNFCVHDSTWEASEAHALDHSPLVDAWVKNDHLGFEVFYVHAGVVHKYRPDFLIRLGGGDMLVLEVKGREREQDHAKRRFLDE